MGLAHGAGMEGESREPSDAGVVSGRVDADANWSTVSEILRNLAIVAAATVGLGLAWWRTAALSRQAASGAAQAAVTKREHAVDVFSRAVSQIGSERLEVRIGAIVSLAALRRDFPELSQSVLDSVCMTSTRSSWLAITSSMSSQAPGSRRPCPCPCPLTLLMIRVLSREWKLPADTLVGEYDLAGGH